MCKKKWVDDLTQVVSVNIKDTILVPETQLVRPLNWRARTQHVMPEHCNPAQHSLNGICELARNSYMVLNAKKLRQCYLIGEEIVILNP